MHRSDARELPVDPDTPQEERDDLVVGDVVELQPAGVDVADRYVVFTRDAAEVARADDLPREPHRAMKKAPVPP